MRTAEHIRSRSAGVLPTHATNGGFPSATAAAAMMGSAAAGLGSTNNSNSSAGGGAWSGWAARATAVAALLLVLVWVHSLGGVAAHKDVASDGSISTDRLFNWHPVLMMLAFGVFMTEAVLAYAVPVSPALTRPQRKRVHWLLHSVAVVSAVLGLVAAWKSHTLKEPPVPNLYSPHSFMGLAALILMVGQYGLGLAAYLWPTFSLEQRQALGPLHRFAGLSVWGTGMTAAALGLQEKASFLQAFGKKGVYSSFIRLPAVMELLLLATVLLVLLQFASSAAASSSGGSSGSSGARRPAVAYTAVMAAEDDHTAV